MRPTLPLLLAATILLFPAAGAAVAQEFSSVEETMTYTEFEAAGLNRLSPEELAQLNRWLRGRLAATQGPGRAGPDEPSDRRGLRSLVREEPVQARIAGEFTGWNGSGTRLVLDNGQVWETIDSGARFRGVRLDSPVVSIRPGMLGSWMLSVEGYNSSVRVRRVQ